MLECVLNVSEGRDLERVQAIADAAGSHLLDLHVDADHNRSVLTVAGAEAAWEVSSTCLELVDISHHEGVHPRLGALDVVPFVPLGRATLPDAVAERDRFAARLAERHGLPCFLYGPGRSLPLVRREAFKTLLPDVGPDAAHPRWGAVAVGARDVLVAYNIWLDPADRDAAARLASELRGPAVRALAMEVTGAVQVSMNLLDPIAVGPLEVYEHVASRADIVRTELVGLVPRAVLERIPPPLWTSLDLSEDRTIERRLELAGLR